MLLKSLCFTASLLLASTAFAYGSVFIGQSYTLDLMAGQKVAEPFNPGEVNREASTSQLSAMFHPTSWFGTGFSGRFVEYNAATLGASFNSASGYDLIWDLKFNTPALQFLGLSTDLFVKAGLVLASDYNVEANAESDDERYQLTGSFEDAVYDIQHKLQGYRTAIGLETVWTDSVKGIQPGVIVEMARGEEKWIKRKYYYQGDARAMTRDDEPTAYEELLIGLHFRK